MYCKCIQLKYIRKCVVGAEAELYRVHKHPIYEYLVFTRKGERHFLKGPTLMK